MKKRLSAADRKLLDAETVGAEKYLCGRLQFKGPIRHVEDGKTEVLVELSYADLVRLLRDYGINRRLCEVAEAQKATPPPESAK